MSVNISFLCVDFLILGDLSIYKYCLIVGLIHLSLCNVLFCPQLQSLLWRREWQPTPAFLPGESQGRGSLVGCRLWGRTESDTTEATQQQQQQQHMQGNATLPIYPTLSFPCCVHMSILYVICFPALKIGSSVPFFQIPYICFNMPYLSFPDDSVVKNHLPMQEMQVGLLGWKIFWRRKCQCSCLGNPTGRGVWQALVHGVAKQSDTTE